MAAIFFLLILVCFTFIFGLVTNSVYSAASSAFISPKQSNFHSLFSKLRVALAICLSIFVNSTFAYDNPSGSTVGPVTTTDSSITNSGTISSGVGGTGINSTGTQPAITINNSGTISMTGGTGNGIYTSSNSGTITTATNSGTITAYMGIKIYSSGSTFTNSASGTIAITGTGNGVTMLSANQTFTNNGVISGSGSSQWGVSVNAAGATINNSNSISLSGNNAVGIYVQISAASITNTGSISATGTNAFGIQNIGTISSLINSQKGLTYTGVLPTNYNTIIRSSSSYGQLSGNSITGSTNFGIYAGSTITTKLYTGVLQGLTTSNVGATRTGTYSGLNYTLALQSGSSTIWDLIFTGGSTADTQQSLVNTASALQGTYTLQNSVIANSFSYDCQVFGTNNVCVSAGGRNTAVQAANGLNNTSALLIAAYRPHPNYRIGAYADQNLSASNPGGTVNLGNNTPLLGLFAAWNERLNGTGAEVKVSAAYGQKNATVTRAVVGTSEPGSGSSNLISQGAQITAKYGFAVTANAVVSPYIGMRYTSNNMGGYTEATSSTVTAPLTYSALNTNATTALAGVGASYKVIPTVMTFASAGVETDTNTANGTYSASGVAGLTPINFNANPVKTRPTAMLGTYYDIAKNQRFGLTGIYRQEAYQAVSTTTVMATYTIGL